MSRNFIFIALLSFISTIVSAQDLKMGPPTFFPDVWGAGRELIKTISDGVLSRQKIQEEAQKRDFGIAGRLLGQKKSYSETMVERRQRIKAVRQEILEANHNLQPIGSKSSQELESELFSLLALGSLPEEEKSNSLMVAPEEIDTPLLLQKSAQSQGWQVPGMLVAPGGGGQASTGGVPTSLKPYDLESSCPECKEEFGIRRWKHHCHVCGEVVCDACRVQKIPAVGHKKHKKACKSCVERHQNAQKARLETDRIQELCDQFSKQTEQSTSTRDLVLSVANNVLGALSSVTPPPFHAVVSAAQKIVSLGRTAVSNTAESQRLAARVARLNLAMMKLAQEGDSPLAQRAAMDLKKVFDQAIQLLNRFQPDPNRSFSERVKVALKQYAESTAKEFSDLHNQLTQIIQDRAFALSLEDKNRLAAPTLSEIKEGIRQELSHVTEEIKRWGQETGQRFNQLEEGLQQLLDHKYGGSTHRQVVMLDPNVVKLEAQTILGTGAFGVVRAGVLYGSTPVAIKQLEHCSGDIAQTLQQEVERMMRVSHPNVVKVHGLLRQADGKTPNAIVMERLGESLETAALSQTLRPEQKMKYTQDVIAGMARVHEGRLVHCDLKPANILLTENKHTAKIIDFGISQGRSTIIFSDAPKSRGTVKYMAPEVLSGQRLGLSCDVYSFGVLLYELWSGRSAWETYSEDQIRINVQRGLRPSTAERMEQEGIPLAISALIEASWNQTPGERPTFEHMMQISKVEDFWETSFSRWPPFLQSMLTSIACTSDLQELRALDSHQLGGLIAAQDPNNRPIADWLQRNLVDGEHFVCHSAAITQEMRKDDKPDRWVVAFENLHQKMMFELRRKQESRQKFEVEREDAQKRLLVEQEENVAIRGLRDQHQEAIERFLGTQQDIRDCGGPGGAEIAGEIGQPGQNMESGRLAVTQSVPAFVLSTIGTKAVPKGFCCGGIEPGHGLDRKAVPVLQWELERGNSRLVTFQEAQAYEANRKKDGWRLPTVWELQALYHQRSVLGDQLDMGWFWSDTEVAGHSNARWRVNFSNGAVSGYVETGALKVRLVRDLRPN